MLGFKRILLKAMNDRTESILGQARRSKTCHDGDTPASSAAPHSWLSYGVRGVVSG